MGSMFSRKVLDHNKEILIHKVPESWSNDKLEKELTNLLNLMYELHALDKEGVEFNGRTLLVSQLKTLTIEYTFMGILYKKTTLQET